MNDLDMDVVPSSPPPLDEKEALRQSIERSEADLRDAVEELTAAVKNDVTLSSYIVERPTVWLGGGFVLGILMAWRR